MNAVKLAGGHSLTHEHLAMFGRYLGMFNSLGRMATDTLGPNATMDQRREALGNVMAMAVLGLVVYPAINGAIRWATGNRDAELRPRGPLAPLTNAYQVVQGTRDFGSALSNIFTFSPGVRWLTGVLSNRDYVGRRIVEPGSPAHKKLGQFAEYTAGTAVAPYSVFGPSLQPGSTRGSPLHECFRNYSTCECRRLNK